jgi:multiple sugar transport system substrate-binding protein
VKHRKLSTVVAVGAASVMLVGCGSSGSSSGGSGSSGSGSAPSTAASPPSTKVQALTTPKSNSVAWPNFPKFTTKVTLNGWGWGSNPQVINKNFEKMYPNITIKWNNVGAGEAEYTKLLAADEAGSGAPDVTGIEYLEMPVFTSKHYLVNLTPLLGTKLVSELKADSPAGIWDETAAGPDLYGVPHDVGPVAFGYRPSIFKKYKLVVPKTWAQYAADAVKLHQANPKLYMGWVPTNSTNDITGLIQQDGGNFFQEISPTSWKITIDSPAAEKIYNFFGDLAKKGDLAEAAQYDPSWEKQLGDGDYAAYLLPAWGPTFEVDEYIKGEQWDLTQPPQWSTNGTPVDYESGGSAVVVTSQSKNPAVLKASALYAAYTALSQSGVAVNESPAIGNFSASLKAADVPGFNTKIPEFGPGVNATYEKIISKDITPFWQWSPWTDYVTTELESVFTNALAGKETFDQALQSAQSAVVKYAENEGYTISQ